MNLNDFVVLPNNKAKSIKLNARNLQELRMETVSLAEENKEMEEKLQQLKKMLPQPTPPPPSYNNGHQMTKKKGLTGTICGQCEVKPAGLVCSQTTHTTLAGMHELYLFEFFSAPCPLLYFCLLNYLLHQLTSPPSSKFLRSPILHLSFSLQYTLCRQTIAGTLTTTLRLRSEITLLSLTSHCLILLQVLGVNHGEEKNLLDEGLNCENGTGFPTSLLRGEYDEEESARSFQEALRQWRGETIDGGDPVHHEREAEGRRSRGALGGIPVRVEFTENSLTYMDRLLLKKHRRYTDRQTKYVYIVTVSTHLLFLYICREWWKYSKHAGTLKFFKSGLFQT
uniref:Uncharacterized protein n=1 Tax=Echeneis naucrates TaxID=173247 RepID=A0A665W2U6_ECHNA